MGRTHQRKDSPRAQRVGSAPINGRANGQRRLRLRVICDAVGPPASQAMSAMLPKAEVNSEHSRFATRCDQLAANLSGIRQACINPDLAACEFSPRLTIS